MSEKHKPAGLDVEGLQKLLEKFGAALKTHQAALTTMQAEITKLGQAIEGHHQIIVTMAAVLKIPLPDTKAVN